MKRVIALVLLLSGVLALFSFNVFAENTYVRELRNYSNSISSVSLTYSATAAQFDYVTESTLSGGMYSPVLITVRFTNNGSNDIKIANSYVDLTFTTYSELSGYDCYTSDLMVQMVKNGNDTPRYNIVASNGYSYGGHVIIPSHSSMYLVFEVDIAAYFDTSSAQIVSPSLDAVLVSVNSSDVVAGDYPTTGSIPEQLDQLETYVSQVAGYTYSNGQSLANITSLLIDIKNQIRFTGTFTPYSPSSYSSSARVEDVSTYTNINRLTIRGTVYPPYIISDDFELSGSNVYQNGFKRYVYTISIEITASNPVAYDNFNFNPPYSHSTSVAGYVTDVKSNFIINVGGTRNNLVLQSGLKYGNKYVIPAGKSFVFFTMYIDVPLNTNVTFNNLSALTSNLTSISQMESVVGYYPYSVQQGIADLYSGMQSSSSVDITSGSNTLNQTESQVHQQEQLYFQQNAQAILDTGLSNYRFNTEQSNGISAVSIDFTSIWNSLGSWNSVYIFSLTLTIALTILRHAPNAISSARRRNYDHNDRGS